MPVSMVNVCIAIYSSLGYLTLYLLFSCQVRKLKLGIHCVGSFHIVPRSMFGGFGTTIVCFTEKYTVLVLFVS